MKEGTGSSHKRNCIWIIITVIIALLTLKMVFKAGNLSANELLAMLKGASPFWLVVSVISMMGFIVMEGMALLLILKAFGYRRGFFQGVGYSAADQFFSAITPSATGGQPASAVMMGKDNIPAGTATAAMIFILILYTSASAVIGLACLIVRPHLFLKYNSFSKVLIIFGIAALTILAIFFIALLKKGAFLANVGIRICFFLHRIGIIRNIEKQESRIRRMKNDYETCARKIKGKHSLIALGFLCNLLQRVGQISVTLTLHYAIRKISGVSGIDIWVIQGFSQIGSNCVPIPGGMGAADYLMIQGFKQMFPENYAYQLQLLSRGLSFYICTILSGIITAVIFIVLCRKRMKIGDSHI